MHSHLGVDSVPELGGARDLNSRKGYFLDRFYLAFS